MAQIVDEKNGGYLVGSTTIFSVVTMNPAENPDFILYVSIQQPEHYSGIQLKNLPTLSLKRVVAMKDSQSCNLPLKR